MCAVSHCATSFLCGIDHHILLYVMEHHLYAQKWYISCGEFLSDSTWLWYQTPCSQHFLLAPSTQVICVPLCVTSPVLQKSDTFSSKYICSVNWELHVILCLLPFLVHELFVWFLSLPRCVHCVHMCCMYNALSRPYPLLFFFKSMDSKIKVTVTAT